MKLFLDEMIPRAVAEQLRVRGWDAICAEECDRRGYSDEAQIRYAAANQRVIATYNVMHFVALVDQFASRSDSHSGVVLIKGKTIRQSDVGGLVRAFDYLFAKYPSDDALKDHCIFLAP